MPVVVTGATGHLGRLVLTELLAEGLPPDRLRAVGRDPARLDAHRAELGIGTVQASYDAPATLLPAMADVSTLLMISGSEVGRRVAQHRAVIEAAVAAGVRRVVYTSVLRASTGGLLIAPEHDATEQLLTEAPVPVTLLRNGWYSENYLATLEQAAATGVILTSAGPGRVASADRADFAAAAARVVLDSESLESPERDVHAGATYELVGDHAWDVDELARVAGEVTGREVAPQRLTPAEHEAALRRAGLDDGTVGFLVGIDADVARGGLDHDSRDLSRLAGRPTTPLADTLRREWAARG